MSVEFDYDYGNLYNEIKDKMMVFADPPETNVPGKHAPHVMYYDVGVHNLHKTKYFLINDVGRAKNGVVRNVKMLYHGDAHISRVVIWQNFNGAVFQFGWFGHHLNSIVIDNIDIIHTDWCTNDGAGHCFLSNNNAVVNLAHLNPTASPEFVMSDIMFRNVNIETECVRLFNFEINDPMSGTFSNIRFVNWDVHSQPTGDKFHNVIKGSQHGRVANWCFENFKSQAGQPLESVPIPEHETEDNFTGLA
nr:hypothetical protein BaRGS_006100 [Batillaria attramentaria]